MATVQTNIAREFKDLDMNFTIHPIRKDVNKLVAERAVINSIKNIVLTAHYEKPFNPDFGSNIRRLLFENLDTLTASAIEREIAETITNYEPRVNLLETIARADFDNNGFKVDLKFMIVNQTQPLSISFFLERIR
jgi:phage baseplate assembly protein W